MPSNSISITDDGGSIRIISGSDVSHPYKDSVSIRTIGNEVEVRWDNTHYVIADYTDYTAPTGASAIAVADAIAVFLDTNPAEGITGSGTTNTVPRFTGASSIGNSVIIISGTGVQFLDIADTTKRADIRMANISTGTTRAFSFQDLSGSLAMLENNLGQFAATTSVQLAGVISDETGSGALVFATSPTLVTPVIGAASGESLSLTSSVDGLSFLELIIQTTGVLAPATNRQRIYLAPGGGQGMPTFHAPDGTTVNFNLFELLTASRQYNFPDASGTIALLSTINAYTSQQYFTEATLTDAAGIDWNLNTQQVARVVLGGNRTLNAPTNIVNGSIYTITVIQDATGSRTLAWNAAFLFPAGIDPVLSTGANDIDIFHFKGHGTTQLILLTASFDVS